MYLTWLNCPLEKKWLRWSILCYMCFLNHNFQKVKKPSWKARASHCPLCPRLEEEGVITLPAWPRRRSGVHDHHRPHGFLCVTLLAKARQTCMRHGGTGAQAKKVLAPNLLTPSWEPGGRQGQPQSSSCLSLLREKRAGSAPGRGGLWGQEARKKDAGLTFKAETRSAPFAAELPFCSSCAFA